MKIIFMGTPDFGDPAVRALVAAGHKIIAVYTRAPKPAGHGMHLQISPIHRLAVQLKVPVFCPTTLRDDKEIRQFKKLKADLAVVAAYGLILPEEILKAPKHGCWNIHASLLPRWRGAAPIQRAIQRGDKKTGVTIMQMDKGLDTGAILAQQEVKITPKMTGGELHDILANLGAELLVKTIKRMPKPVPQRENDALYAPKLDKDEMFIDWNLTPENQLNFIHAMTPFPGAFCYAPDPFHKGQLLRLKIHDAEIIPNLKTKRADIGCILDNAFAVASGQGAIRITKLQRAGKGIQSAEDFLNGMPLEVGMRLTGRDTPSLTFILNVDGPTPVYVRGKINQLLQPESRKNSTNKKRDLPFSSKKKEIRANIQRQLIIAALLLRKSKRRLYKLISKTENRDSHEG